jgi:D-specific alpha-keto acid dehydrogenase
LDVLEGEEGIFYLDCDNPPSANPQLLRLQRMPNVVISPHTAYYTDHALSDIVAGTISNCLEFERENVACNG